MHLKFDKELSVNHEFMSFDLHKRVLFLFFFLFLMRKVHLIYFVDPGAVVY